MLRQINSMSRHSWPGWVGFLSRLGIFRSRQVGQGKEKSCRNRAILCHDRVDHNREKFYYDRGFWVATELATTKEAKRARQTWTGWEDFLS